MENSNEKSKCKCICKECCSQLGGHITEPQSIPLDRDEGEECHCSRTSRYHQQDPNYNNHSYDRCWKRPNLVPTPNLTLESTEPTHTCICGKCKETPNYSKEEIIKALGLSESTEVECPAGKKLHDEYMLDGHCSHCHKSQSSESTEMEEWQRKFLNNGTLLGCGDLSIMIQVVSAILNSHSQKLVSELKNKIEANRCNIKFDVENNKITPRIEYEKEGVYLKYVDVVDLINNIK